MCNPASFVLTKDNVFWSKNTDHHNEIMEENNLRDTFAGKPQILKVEITPNDGDLFSDINKWVFRFDQDILPDWANKEKDEKRTRGALQGWCERKLISGVTQELTEGEFYVSGSAQIKRVSGSAQINYVYGSAQIKRVYGSAQINEVSGSAQINEVSGSAQSKRVYGSAQINYVYGSAQINEVSGSAQINEVSGSAQINAAGSATITKRGRGNSRVTLGAGSHAALLDRRNGLKITVAKKKRK